MSSNSIREINQPIRRGLGQLRGRVRSILIVLGTSRVMVVVVAALIAFFVADYTLRLPLAVRTTLNLGIWAACVVLVARHLVRPLAMSLSDEMLAERVEAAYPDLENRLSSSLAFAHAHEDPDNDDSEELMRAVAEQTASLVPRIRFAEVARTTATTRWAGAAVGLLLAMAISAVANASTVATFIQRSLLMRDVAWPRRTTLAIEDMRPGEPRRVTKGRDATIKVRATGSVPDRVLFTFWEQGSPERSLETLDLTPDPEDPSSFSIALPVYASYEFTVSGGDDDRELVYIIEALTPPTILSITMDVTYPEYLGIEAETLSGGDQRVPEGSKVDIHIKPDRKCRVEVRLAGEKKPGAVASREETTTFSLEAKKDLRYSVSLTGDNGEQNDPTADSFVLRVLKDQAPVLRVRTPSTREQRAEGGVVMVAFSARDDYTVRTARLHYRIDDAAPRTLDLGSNHDAVRLITPEEREDDHLPGLAVIDLARLKTADGKPVSKGNRVVFHVDATDSKGQVARTRSDYMIDVVAEDGLTQLILSRQNSLYESAQRAEEHARTASTESDEARAHRGAEPATFRRWSGRAQAAQARVLSDLDSLARSIREVLNLYVFNRLDKATAVEQMLPFYEQHLLRSDRSGSAFSGELYRELWQAQTDRTIRAGGSLAKLVEMADLSDRLGADHAPAAYKALGRLEAGADEAQLDEAFQEIAREQQAVRDGIARLARLMREWQNYEGIVRFFKGLKERETDFIQELEGLTATEEKR
ncbi:MAG: hypothetical protein ACYTGN_01695 [Planctomycetota bacterium]